MNTGLLAIIAVVLVAVGALIELGSGSPRRHSSGGAVFMVGLIMLFCLALYAIAHGIIALLI